MAQQVSPNRLRHDGVFFPDGVNSYLEPDVLKDSQVRWLINAVNAGGIIQVRPGNKTRYSFCDTEGHPQLLTMFQPTGDTVYLVVGIAGRIYTLKTNGNGTFQTAVLLSGIQFDPNADQLFWCKTVKAADLGPDGVKRAITPRNVLMFQDGFGRSAYWDGTAHGHLNPTQLHTVDSGSNTIYAQGMNQTPIGTVMAWSGNRLWVAVGNKVIASDINDPWYFTECQDFTLVPFYLFEGDVSGIIDRGTSGRNESTVFVWTNSPPTTNTLRSGILNRSLWNSTADFQKKIFAGVGCVAPKSPIVHDGLLYWSAAEGLLSFDSIDTVNSTQRITPIDQAMVFSKTRMWSNKSATCTGFFGPYVFVSVPSGRTIEGRVYNRQTQVINRDVINLPDTQVSAWQGIWTGINPVEWATGEIDGAKRVFALSKDADGVIRIWESMQGNRCDNGHPIPWLVVTKDHTSGNVMDLGAIRFFNLRLCEILGVVSVKGYWKGVVGVYKKLMDIPSVVATPGSILTPGYSVPFTFGTVGESFQPQSRYVTSPTVSDKLTCSSGQVESYGPDQQDFSFSLMLRFVGRAALKAYRINVDQLLDKTGGEVTPPETGLHILRAGIAEEGSCPQFVKAAPGAPVPSPSDFTFADSPAYDALLPRHQSFPSTEEENYVSPTDGDCDT